MICAAPTCARTDTRRYLIGHSCPDHTPAANAGRPEPGRTGDSSWMQRTRFHTPLPTRNSSPNDDAEVL